MPSIAVDVLLCLVLVGGAYILFGRPALQQGGKPGGNKKKKRSKGKKGQGQAVDAFSQGGSETKPARVETAAKEAARSNGYPAPSKAKQRTTTNGQANNCDANKVIDTSASNNAVTQVANDKAGLLEPVSSYASRAASHGAPPKPLAERRAKVQAKTVVDDMVEKDDALQGQKVFAQTMRIVKPQPAKPLLLDDGEDEVDDEQAASMRESAWQSVPVSKKSSSIRITASAQPQTSSQAAVGRSVPGLPEQTKKQRQNARKAAEVKAAREQAEADRLQRLAAHKRALERERMDAQSKQKNKSQPPHVQKSRREEVGGGMNAAVYDGKLIWE